MSMERVMGGEGAAMPWLRTETRSTHGLVVFPMFAPDAGMDVTMAQQIYRLAYEKAQASLRPSAYEIALRAGWN